MYQFKPEHLKGYKEFTLTANKEECDEIFTRVKESKTRYSKMLELRIVMEVPSNITIYSNKDLYIIDARYKGASTVYALQGDKVEEITSYLKEMFKPKRKIKVQANLKETYDI